MMKSTIGQFAAAILTAAFAGVAHAACEKVHMLDYMVQKGAHEISINGVFIGRAEKVDGSFSGGRPLLPYNWVIQGKNTIRINFYEKNKPVAGKFSVVTGCRGSFDRDPPIAEAVFDKAGVQTLTFDYPKPVDAAHARADAAGDDGLMAAVKALQSAVANKNADAVIAAHAELLKDAQSQGAPLPQIKAFLTDTIKTGKAQAPGGLRAESAMDGKVYVVLTNDKRPPVTIVKDDDDGELTWRSGAYWGRIDGRWQVIQLYRP